MEWIAALIALSLLAAWIKITTRRPKKDFDDFVARAKPTQCAYCPDGVASWSVMTRCKEGDLHLIAHLCATCAKEMIEAMKEQPEDLGPHRTQETRERHPQDERLRTAGYKLYMRPEAGEPLWIKSGLVFKESKALELVEDARRKAKQ